MFCTTFAQPARCHAESSIRNKNTFLDFKACVFLSISKTPKNKKAKKKKGGVREGKKEKGILKKILIRPACYLTYACAVVEGSRIKVKGLGSRV